MAWVLFLWTRVGVDPGWVVAVVCHKLRPLPSPVGESAASLRTGSGLRHPPRLAAFPVPRTVSWGPSPQPAAPCVSGRVPGPDPRWRAWEGTEPDCGPCHLGPQAPSPSPGSQGGGTCSPFTWRALAGLLSGPGARHAHFGVLSSLFRGQNAQKRAPNPHSPSPRALHVTTLPSRFISHSSWPRPQPDR